MPSKGTGQASVSCRSCVRSRWLGLELRGCRCGAMFSVGLTGTQDCVTLGSQSGPTPSTSSLIFSFLKISIFIVTLKNIYLVLYLAAPSHSSSMWNLVP